MAYKTGLMLVHGMEIRTLKFEGQPTRYFSVVPTQSYGGRVREYLPGTRSEWVWAGPGLRRVETADQALSTTPRGLWTTVSSEAGYLAALAREAGR